MSTAWFANVFSAVDDADESLSAVSFYTASPNSKFTLYIYKNATSGPRSGTLAGTVEGTIASAGYHTISIGAPIFLRRGENFSVVVKLETPGYTYPIPIEYPWPGYEYSSLATANSGESYVSPNGTEWDDLPIYNCNADPDDPYYCYANTNVCLKAFTTTIVEGVSTPIYLSGPAGGVAGTTYTYHLGGSISNVDHPLQYFVDWGDGSDSGWLPAGTTRIAKSWLGAGTYPARVKARCGDHPGFESEWAGVLDVVISDSPYPAVTLLAPATDSGIPSGSTYRIQWEAPAEAGTFNVTYSTNNGKTWKLLPEGANLTTKYYDWTVPTSSKNLANYRIRVVGYSGTIEVGEDLSSSFVIEGVRLTSPDGGEGLVPGDTQTISWVTNATSSAVANVRLYYSENDGSSWELIEELESNLGSYIWTVPPVSEAKANCRVKVVLRKASGSTVGSDISDGVFSIDPNP